MISASLSISQSLAVLALQMVVASKCGTVIGERAGVKDATTVPSWVGWNRKGWGRVITGLGQCFVFPSVLWQCWLGDRKDIHSIKTTCSITCRLSTAVEQFAIICLRSDITRQFTTRTPDVPTSFKFCGPLSWHAHSTISCDISQTMQSATTVYLWLCHPNTYI